MPSRSVPLKAPGRWLYRGTVLAAVLAWAALAVLAGCATPGKPAPAPALPSAAELGLPATIATADAPNEWWWMFNDPRLDELIQQALLGQPTLLVVQSRLARAQALLASTVASQAPQLGASADLNWQHYTARGLVPPPIAGSERVSANLQLGASVALDFFGRNAAALKAALGAQRAAQADVEAAKVLIAAQVARGYLGLARLTGWRELTQRSLAQREAALALVQQRVKAGIDTEAEVAIAQTSLAEGRLQLEALTEQTGLARHALAALCGLAPQAVDDLAPKLPALQPAQLPKVLGADLLGRRVDVLAARWRVEAATGTLDQAMADFYPDINLAGFVGLNALGLDRLLALPSRNFGVGPALRLPVFDAGRLQAQQRGREAEVAGAVAAYRGVLLDAAREALDALASLQSLQRQLGAQAAAVAAAQRGWTLARERRQAGVGTELQVLAAETPLLAQRRSLVDLHARLLETQVALIHALGGGWTLPAELKTLAPLRSSDPVALKVSAP